MRERVIYYEDPLQDDFAGTRIKTRKVGKDFPFVRRGLLWRFASFLIYYGIAAPLVWLISKIYLGLRIENRGVLKQAGKSGYFLYGNHTRYLDPFIPPMAAFPRRAYTVANADAVSLPGLGWLTQMLGAFPVPTERAGLPVFTEAVLQRAAQGNAVAIYPEAHIWPFYTGVRPFRATSFRYPVKAQQACFIAVTTYRRRRGLFAWARRPGMTVHIEGPFYPNPELREREAAGELRDRVYRRMCVLTEREDNICYIRYVRRRKEESHDDIDEGPLRPQGDA